MLTHLVALGLLSASSSSSTSAVAVVTPPERTIVVGRAGVTPAAEGMNPGDTKDYMLDMSPLPDVDHGEDLLSASIVVLPAAVNLGFQIETAAPYAPVLIDSTHLQFWASVADQHQEDAVWANGQSCGFYIDAGTNSGPPRHYRHVAPISVTQK